MLLSVLSSKSSILSSFGTLFAATFESGPSLLRFSEGAACTIGFDGVLAADGRSWLKGFSGCAGLGEAEILIVGVVEEVGEGDFVEVDGAPEAFCSWEVDKPDNFAKRLFRICL